MSFQAFDVSGTIESEDSVDHEERNFLFHVLSELHTFGSIPGDFTSIKDGVGIDDVIGNEVAFGGVGGDGSDEKFHGGDLSLGGGCY